jgi:hypothetical protein
MCTAVVAVCHGLASAALAQVATSTPIKSEAIVKTSSRGYAPEQATGEPDTAYATDSSTAWTPQEMDAGLEWLQVSFEKSVAVAEVRIRESYNPGAISKVTAILPDNSEMVLWEGRAPVSEAPCDLVVRPDTPVEARTVKVYLDTARVPGWNEIDAVALIGTDSSRQWAASAKASSSYGSAGFGYGTGNELASLLGSAVNLHLEGNVILSGKLLRNGNEFLALEIESNQARKTVYVNRQKLLYVEPQSESRDERPAAPGGN